MVYIPPHARGSETMRTLFLGLAFASVAGTGLCQQSAYIPNFTVTFGSPIAFATHAELASYGFLYGPSDGAFGGIATGATTYTFYGDAASNASCAGTAKNLAGSYAFSATLDHVTGSAGCRRMFGPGDAPSGWAFANDYAGGGQVVRFSLGGVSGFLMVFHSEFHWLNPANPPSQKCFVNGSTTSAVPCFYSSLGLAVSTDNGQTFRIVGQIMQPSQPLSAFEGGGTNMDVGYGSLIVADANGAHVDNPPADPSRAYFYVLFDDFLPGLPGVCANSACMGIARAAYNDVVTAVLSGDAHRVAQVFHKYDGASPDPWTQPATSFVQGSATPDLSGTAGKYAPLWTDQTTHEPVVIYDRSFDVYLVVYPFGGGPVIRASKDLIHWSKPFPATYSEGGNNLIYPTLVGETGDPTIGGLAPRVYFSSFPAGKFPDYTTATFESVPLILAPLPRHHSARH
jgi:hypothetical protein